MFKLQLGNIMINPIVESEMANAYFDPLSFFPETTPEDWERHKSWLQPQFQDPASGKLIFTVQSFLLRTRHHNILIDTCVGDHKQRLVASWNMTADGIFLKRLAAAGVQPEDVDYVICTHIHQDHVGWNTRMHEGRWVPTFPKAIYAISQKEYEHWRSMAQPPNQAFADSVMPVIEAGRASLITSDFAIDDEVWVESTPGHTPDHLSVHLESNGTKAVIAGDVMHSPVQCVEPDWIMFADFDRELARKTRRNFLERYCDNDVLVCFPHFPSPSLGHIIRRGNTFWFQF